MKSFIYEGDALKIIRDKYQVTGGLCVSLIGSFGPFCKLSFCDPEIKIADDEFLLKDWSENEEVAEEILKSGLVEIVGYKHTGVGHTPVCKLVED